MKPDLDHLPTIIVAPPASGDAGVIINAAIMSVTFNGTRPGRVLLLPGTYNVISRIWMVSGLVIQGQPDWSAQLINLQTQGFGDGSRGFTGIAIDAYKGPDLNATTFISDVSLVDVYIDIRSITNFYTAISIADVRGVWIEHCFFDNSLVPPAAAIWTIHAVLMDVCDEVVITGCRSKYSQFKTASTGSGSVEVSYNYCETPTNFGFSHVLQTDGVLGPYRAVGNYVKDSYGQGGFYWGNDSTVLNYGLGRACRFENNVVDGVWTAQPNGTGLTVRPLARNDSVILTGNVSVNRTTGAQPNNGYGIAVKAQVFGTRTSYALITDNYCENSDREGLLVTGGFDLVDVARNQCYRTRAPQILLTAAAGSIDEIRARISDSITPVVTSGRVEILSS